MGRGKSKQERPNQQATHLRSSAAAGKRERRSHIIHFTTTNRSRSRSRSSAKQSVDVEQQKSLSRRRCYSGGVEAQHIVMLIVLAARLWRRFRWRIFKPVAPQNCKFQYAVRMLLQLLVVGISLKMKNKHLRTPLMHHHLLLLLWTTRQHHQVCS